jgi:hypothetical protein
MSFAILTIALGGDRHAASKDARNPSAGEVYAVPITTVRRATDESAFAAGFVAAEGTFIATGTPPTFTFAVRLGAADGETCHWLQGLLGAGFVRSYGRRKAHYDDEVCFAVRRLEDLVEIVVPFMDSYLPPCHKRTQFEDWKRQLLDYWEWEARRRRPCSSPGCSSPQQAKGFCRRHYYQAFGR